MGGGEGLGSHARILPVHVFPGTIALLAEDGHLVKLEEETTQAPSMACSLIQEQVTYVLVQIGRAHV